MRPAWGESRQCGRRAVGRSASFVLVAFAFAVTMLGTTLPTPLYPIYRAELGLSELTVTIIFAVYAAGVIVALVLFGNLSDEIGRRRTLLPGLACSALSAIAFVLAAGLPLILAGRVLSGLSAGLFTGAATGALVDLAPDGDGDRASLVASVVNIGGLALGPVLAGVLSQYAGAPLRLAFWVDLALLLPAAVGLWLLAEPVEGAEERPVRIRPTRLGVPDEARAVFVPAAIAAFAGFAVLGLFTAVAPAFLSEVLDIGNHAVTGLAVLAVFGSSTLGQAVGRGLSSDRALPLGCALLIAGMAMLAVALSAASLGLLLAGGAVAGFGRGMAFAAGLAAVNEAAPAERRAGTASSYFVVAYGAISIPVIGIGLLARASDLVEAGTVFAAIDAVLAAAAIAAILRLRRRRTPA